MLAEWWLVLYCKGGYQCKLYYAASAYVHPTSQQLYTTVTALPHISSLPPTHPHTHSYHPELNMNFADTAHSIIMTSLAIRVNCIPEGLITDQDGLGRGLHCVWHHLLTP